MTAARPPKRYEQKSAAERARSSPAGEPSGLEAQRQRAARLAGVLEARIESAMPRLFGQFPPHRLAALALEPPGSGQEKLPAGLLSAFDALRSHAPWGEAAYGRFLMAALMARADAPLATITLPASVLALYPRQFERLLTALQDPARPFDMREDRWRKDFALLTGRLVPVGAEFADPWSGIPRRCLLRGSLPQRLALLATVVRDTRGLRPLLELHAHPDSLEDFNPEGWRATYHRLAELLLANPGYRGVMASSWFRDPRLAAISPRLGYLREYPLRHGAKLFWTGRDGAGTSGALARSPTRQRLFAEGKYVPDIHLMVWPRDALLEWHRHDAP